MAPKKHIQFSIPEPCHVPWEGMSTIDSVHRHCSSCDKVITNFSEMSDDELILYFKHSQGKTCGLFAKDQLDRRITLLPEKSQKAGWWRMILFIPLSLFNKSVRAQYYETVNGNKQSDSVSLSTDSIQSKPVIAETKVDSTKNVDSAQITSFIPVDSLVEQTGKNSNSDDSLPTITNIGPREIFGEQILVLSGDIIQTTTMGICSMPPLQPGEPDIYTASFWERLFPSFMKISPPVQQIDKPDPRKMLSDKLPEKPKPQQPALPASNEIAAIMPAEKRKWWNS